MALKVTPAVLLLVPLALSARNTEVTLSFVPNSVVNQHGSVVAMIEVTEELQFGTAPNKYWARVPVTTGSVSLYLPHVPQNDPPKPLICENRAGQSVGDQVSNSTALLNGQGIAEIQMGSGGLGLTGTVGTTGYIARYGSTGSDYSGCLDLTVIPGPTEDDPDKLNCLPGVNTVISTTQIGGPGAPLANVENTYELKVKVYACKDLAIATAQGGVNAWAGLHSFEISKGVFEPRKQTGGKNAVYLWNIGAMGMDTSATATLRIVGTIKRGTPCGTAIGLLGSWSATSTNTDIGAVPVKSDYTGSSGVIVGCPAP
jgi:hypothetical protein